MILQLFQSCMNFFKKILYIMLGIKLSWTNLQNKNTLFYGKNNKNCDIVIFSSHITFFVCK